MSETSRHYLMSPVTAVYRVYRPHIELTAQVCELLVFPFLWSAFSDCLLFCAYYCDSEHIDVISY